MKDDDRIERGIFRGWHEYQVALFAFALLLTLGALGVWAVWR
jgi:hypothetical protein